MIKYLTTASLLFAGAYLSTAPALAADPGITDTEIVIGDVEPLTGPPALLGVAASIGHKIAIAEANAAGGINGRKIKYVLDDYGITVRDGFDTVVKAKKLNVVYSGNYKKGQQDFSSDMLQLKESGAEVFLAGGIIGENIAMMKELEKLNIKPVVGIFWPGRVEPLLKLFDPAVDGIFAVDYIEPFAGPAGEALLV